MVYIYCAYSSQRRFIWNISCNDIFKRIFVLNFSNNFQILLYEKIGTINGKLQLLGPMLYQTMYKIYIRRSHDKTLEWRRIFLKVIIIFFYVCYIFVCYIYRVIWSQGLFLYYYKMTLSNRSIFQNIKKEK